jgi:hypothetical protein
VTGARPPFLGLHGICGTNLTLLQALLELKLQLELIKLSVTSCLDDVLTCDLLLVLLCPKVVEW